MVNQKMSDLCVIFYIFDDLNRFIDSFTLNSYKLCEPRHLESSEMSRKRKKHFVAVVKGDGYFLSVFNRMIKMSQLYSDMVLDNLIKTIDLVPNGLNISVKFQLVKPKLDILDYAWNDRLYHLVVERQELEHAMSWLSTLGGAFSALGDTFENCAKVAGKISIQQFQIAFQLGEPLLVARCRLYMALSLIQLGKLKAAKSLVQKQYEVAKSYKDFKLQNMCKGIWAKLQYTYAQRKLNSKKSVF